VAAIEKVNAESEAAIASYEADRLAWFSELWLNVDLDEARQICDHLEANDPVALDWLFEQSTKIVGNYRKEKLGN